MTKEKLNMSNVADYFKAPGEVRAKKERGGEYFYNNKSVYSKNYVKTRYENTTSNTFSAIVKDDNVTDIRLVDLADDSIHAFPKSSNNMMGHFYFKDKKIDYKEIVKVEETTSEGYGILTMQGYNNFYKIYKKNQYGNEYCLCILATRVV